MKLKSLFIALVLTIFSSSAFAQFYANAQMFVNPTVATARVYNVWGRPVHCQGQVAGLTSNGVPVTAWFNDFIPAGQFREVYVYTNAYNPFVDARSQIFCR